MKRTCTPKPTHRSREQGNHTAQAHSQAAPCQAKQHTNFRRTHGVRLWQKQLQLEQPAFVCRVGRALDQDIKVAQVVRVRRGRDAGRCATARGRATHKRTEANTPNTRHEARGTRLRQRASTAHARRRVSLARAAGEQRGARAALLGLPCTYEARTAAFAFPVFDEHSGEVSGTCQSPSEQVMREKNSTLSCTAAPGRLGVAFPRPPAQQPVV